ncbi:MAG: membrane protein insertase YidC [Rhodocyclaceae bacterium]|nr:membrane protein insertase YidC [Rhodocyclaceae bacterium]
MDNQRLILFLVFSFSLVMLWDAWQRQHLPQPQATSSTAATNAGAPTPTPLPATSMAAVPTPNLPAGSVVLPTDVVAPAGQPRAIVRTDLFVAEISALGGDITRLELTRHKATEDMARNFVIFEDKHAYAAQSGLIGATSAVPGAVVLPSHKTVWRLPESGAELANGQDELRLRLEAPAAEGGVAVAKTYVFRRGSYLIDVEYEVANGGSAPLGGYAYFQFVRNDVPPDGANAMMSTFTGPAFFSDAEKYQKVAFEDIAKGKAKHAGKVGDGWVAMVQHYFVSAWLPPGKGEREFFTRKIGDNLFAAGVILPVAPVAPGATAKLVVPLYAGPQEQAKLEKIATGLDLVVDYGWLTVIAAPLYWVLELIHRLLGNWGWAIIGLTMLLKAAFFPLSAASYKSMAKMRLLTPKLMKLKEAYADDKQRMNQEMMELYKREKVNPLGGCLPVLVQIPVFIALYWVLLGSVEMRQTPWLGWITDLSAKDPYFVLPLIMGATMFIQTKLNPTPPDPMQAKIMLFMPIVFTGMFLFFPSGLVLYWTVNNVLSIAQQWQVNRMIEKAGLKAH